MLVVDGESTVNALEDDAITGAKCLIGGLDTESFIDCGLIEIAEALEAEGAAIIGFRKAGGRSAAVWPAAASAPAPSEARRLPSRLCNMATM